MEAMAMNEEYRAQEVERIDLMGLIDDMYNAFRKYWKRYLIIVVAAALISVAITFFLYTPVYKAYSTFTVTTKTAEFYNSSGAYNQRVTKNIGESLTYILDSDVLQEMVAEELEMETVPGTISAQTMSTTNLITLTVEADDPQLAYDILQATIKSFPKVSQYIIGDVSLEEMDSSGVPEESANAPHYVRRIINGILIGMLICFLLMLFYALTRKTIHTEDDLKEILNVPSLGSIPAARFKERRNIAPEEQLLLMDHKGIPPTYQEAIRNVRTRVVRNAKKDGIHTILITSSLQGEGKSTVAANLAISMFRQGYKVILVDGDLRNPSLARALGMKQNGPGLREILEGEATAEEAMIPYVRSDSKNQREHQHLKIILGSSRPAKATVGLINSDTTAALFRQLREEADFVIIDTPPSAILSDAAAWGQFADGAVFVVRQDFASQQSIHEGMEMIASSGIRLVGCVLNNSSASFTGKGYGYGYGRYGKYGRYGRYGRYGYGKYGRYGKYGYGNKYGKYGKYGYGYGKEGYGYGKEGYGYGYGYGEAYDGYGYYGYGENIPEIDIDDEEYLGLDMEQPDSDVVQNNEAGETEMSGTSELEE